MNIDITSKEAETILFSLAMRSKQKRLSAQETNEVVSLGNALDHWFANEFGWNKNINRMKHYRRPIKSVNIKCYDFPPEDL